MATMRGSSVGACLNFQGRRKETKVNLTQLTLNNNQAFTYVGLRSLNKLHVRSTARVASSSLKTSEKSGSGNFKGKIVCGGMNLVFVGAEVGPWSKTGGLGDVLGGLPPVLAVSLFYISIFIVKFKFTAALTKSQCHCNFV